MTLKLTCMSAAAAAKIKASIEAKKGIQHVDVPPIRSTQSPNASSDSPARKAENSASTISGDMYIADGDYIRDIEVNDLKNRYTLTKGSTQKMVNTPCVIFPLIAQSDCSHFQRWKFPFCPCSGSCPLETMTRACLCFPFPSCVEIVKLT